MQNSKVFFIPIETKVRDYESRLLISLKILSLGKSKQIKIFFGERRKLLSLLDLEFQKKIKHFVYLALGVDQQVLFYHNLIKKNGIFTSLDEESAIFSSNIKNAYNRHIFNKDCLNYIYKIFVWGKFDNDSILNNNKLSKEKIKISGNPRFDLSKKKFDFFYEKKFKQKILNKKIFINCAFGLINNYVDQKVDTKIWSIKVKNYPSYKNLWKSLDEYESTLFPRFIEGITYLIKSLPNENFVIRPHPIENEQIYINLFKDFPNVIIDKKSSIQSEFLNSKLIIHNGCTTAVEGTFHDLNVICFNPFFQSENVQTLTYEVSNLIQDKFILLDHVKKILIHEIPPHNLNEIKSKYIKPIIDNIDYDSYAIIAEELFNIDQNPTLELYKNKISRVKIFEKINIIEIKIRYKIVKLFSDLIIKFFYKNYFNQIKMREKSKSNLEIIEISNDINILKEFLNIQDKIYVNEIKDGCFELSLEN